MSPAHSYEVIQPWFYFPFAAPSLYGSNLFASISCFLSYETGRLTGKWSRAHSVKLFFQGWVRGEIPFQEVQPCRNVCQRGERIKNPPQMGEKETSRIRGFLPSSPTSWPHLPENQTRSPEQARCTLTDDSSSSVWGRVSLRFPSLTVSRLSRPRCHVGTFKCCNSIQLYLFGASVTIKRAHGLQEHGRIAALSCAIYPH